VTWAPESREVVDRFVALAVGRRCRIERCEHSWLFDFEGACRINVECPWRILVEGGIAFADTDHGQQFGLPHRVDGEATANELITGRVVEHIAIADFTADVAIMFSDGTKIELFNHSAGYEGWQAWGTDGEGQVSIIGMGGGELALLVH
jgi:hypothetical protein